MSLLSSAFLRRWMLFQLLGLVPAILFSQITIRERVELKPQTQFKVAGTTQVASTSLRFVFKSEYPVLLRMIINEVLTWGGPGEAELTIPDAPYGVYSFNLQARVAELGDPYVGTAVTFDIYVGGVLVRHDEGRITGGSYDIFGLWFPPNFVYAVPPVVRIKIQLASSTLAPLGDNDNKNNPNKAETTRPKVIDFSKVKPTTVTVTVKYSDGQPVPDYPFTLSAYVRDNSGGHDHTANRPTGRFIKSKDTVTTFSDKTGSDGTVAYRYLCSGFGGVDSLRVKGITEEDTASAIVLLKVKVLEELGASARYVLIGDKPPHPRNHFGTKKTVDNLKMLADSANGRFSWILQYNDISLANGGPYDFSPQYYWNTPHQMHREGRNVDMRIVSTAGDSIKRGGWFKRFVENVLMGKVAEEDTLTANRHFHLTF